MTQPLGQHLELRPVTKKEISMPGPQSSVSKFPDHIC